MEIGLVSSAGAPNWNKLMCSEPKVVKWFPFMCNSRTNKQTTLHSQRISSCDCGAWLDGLGLSSRLKFHTLLSWDVQKAWLDCRSVRDKTQIKEVGRGCVCNAFLQRKLFCVVLLSLIKLLKSNSNSSLNPINIDQENVVMMPKSFKAPLSWWCFKAFGALSKLTESNQRKCSHQYS